ncbi:MAG: DUF3014 domain-containing protein [Deltaproteobacteria bacterium]|nr:DUF3014 domain-containing protein [Deltaproteobacteria bacterium]
MSEESWDLPSPSPSPPHRPWALWIVGALVVAVLGAGALAYFGVISLPFAAGLFAGDAAPTSTDASSTALDGPADLDAASAGADTDTDGVSGDDSSADSPAEPLGPDAELRRLLRAVSTSRRLRAWASADGILKRLVAATWLVAQGRSPRAVVSFLEIEGDFTVLDRKDGIFVDPASYRRYDAFAQAVRTIDAEALGRGYAELRPHVDAAFAEVSTRGERFDDVLARALRRLVAVRVPKGDIALVERGAIFLFQDGDLEAMSDAEKHLLRMGPTNARRVQRTLRAFGRAAGLL